MLLALGTYEILSVTINTTYPLGRWTADCVFISCSQSIGCLVYLNDTHCAAFTRGLNSSMNVSCPVQYNDSFPGPGGYVVKAYAVHVLSNGSIYHPLAYMEFRVLTNQGIQNKIVQLFKVLYVNCTDLINAANTTLRTKVTGTQTSKKRLCFVLSFACFVYVDWGYVCGVQIIRKWQSPSKMFDILLCCEGSNIHAFCIWHIILNTTFTCLLCNYHSTENY